MDPQASQNTQNYDLKILSSFLYELNIARRYVQSYPPNHPNIVTSTLKVLQHLAKLLEHHDSITLGVARNSLVLESGQLDRTNPVYRDLADFLFNRAIASISFLKQLPLDELTAFNQLVVKTPQQIRDKGGIVAALADAGIYRIKVEEIDYGSFRITEEASIAAPSKMVLAIEGPALWGRFVQGLMAGNLDPSGRLLAAVEDIDPENLALFMNEHADRIIGPAKVSYEQAIASFLRQADKSEPELDEEAESIDKLGTFIKRLSPELRSQFLRSSIDSGKEQAEVAKKLIARFPDDVILDALDDVNERGANLSQGVINFLQATARTSRGRSRRSGPTIIDTMAEEELGQKLRFMFREDVPERYIPPDYQKTLRAIAGVRALMVLDEQKTIDLRQEIEGFPVEMQLCDIIMEIIDQDLEHGEGELLQHRLLEFCSLFLETGNFLALANIHRHLSRQCHGASFGFMPFHEAVLDFFVQPEVIAEVLNALTVWGKAKYEELQALVDGVGEPFVEPIFQRLAEETNMSLRRFYLDRLQSQGEATRAAAIAHLEDKRWFVVRNSIFLLRGMGNPAVLRHLRAVVDHPHPKVRHEVLKTLAHFRHPEAERLLVRELEGTNHEMRLLAIQAAEPSRDPRIVDALRAILNSKGVSEADIELKVAALRTLGKIGTRLVLPDIDRLLSAKAMLRSGGLQRLKAEVMKVLEEFPSTLARPALERVVKSGPTEFMPLARQILQRHDGVTP